MYIYPYSATLLSPYIPYHRRLAYPTITD